ncbi:sarcosine oxidase subunit gamma [Arthrobacter subterraneus]|uniref:Sarcosine oxidase subunit gamma n=1 Tax=Arthrobacter subterraneus TaxID=335973 RepID=A0A1G8HDL1_9MICC|nr:sarcosine oxidase subunit gamma family protein [Arthrobacter subterraneus]SDI04754.1 sarcosine oxidase subunit gamma [Arthrobacter subterraneus]
MAEQVTMTSPTSPTSPLDARVAGAQLRRSPLAHLEEALWEGTNPGAALHEVPFLTMVGLRADPASPAGDALSAAAGAPLPTRCGEVSGSPAGTAILWQGPDEFLLVAPDGSDAARELAVALGDAPGAVVDLSANRTTLELSGPSARKVLEKGCPLDLHPRVFKPGTAVSTLLGPVPVLLWQVDETTYRIFPRASFAEYVARWLLDAVAEFGSPEVP